MDYFYSLTSRQISALSPVIEDRSHKEFEVLASLHGKKVKPRPDVSNLLNLSPEQEIAQDKDALDLHNRMKQRAAAKSKG